LFPSALTETSGSWQQVFDMKRYFISQLKRGIRFVPGLVIVAAILFACLGIVFSAIAQANEEESTSRFQIGMVGTVGDTYLELGLAALQMMDATRFSMELLPMEEDAAAAALAKGDIVAYVVIPEGFMSAAMSGHLIPIEFVSASDAADFTTFIKREFTAMVEDIVLSSQYGSYGVGNALVDAGHRAQANKHVNDISVEYVKYVLARGKVYEVSSLGISSELSMESYILCGLSILFFLMCGLPFAPYLIKKDLSLEKVLWIRRCTPGRQVLCEWLVYFLFLMIPASFLLVVLSETQTIAPNAVLTALPAFFALSAMSYFLFRLSRDLVSGVLLPFFASICLAFVSGCIYPVYFFPIALQKLSVYLPTGLARMQISACITGKALPETGILLILYGIGFLLLSTLLRRKKLQGGAL